MLSTTTRNLVLYLVLSESRAMLVCLFVCRSFLAIPLCCSACLISWDLWVIKDHLGDLKPGTELSVVVY